MSTKLKAAIVLCASAFLQMANADQQFSYSETFTNPSDTQSSFVLSGLFNESTSGALTSLSSSILTNGGASYDFNVELIASNRASLLAHASADGIPLEIDGYFLGASGNRNTVTSCGQVFLSGVGCTSWQKSNPSVVSQGLTDIRTAGAGVGGAVLSTYAFAQTGGLQIAAVPEPSTVYMLFAGLGLLCVVNRPKKAR